MLIFCAVLWYNGGMKTAKDTDEVCTLARQHVLRTQHRCAENKMTVTLWLLFDTAADRDTRTRDEWLRDFKRYAKSAKVPRSVREGSLWLARQEV